MAFNRQIDYMKCIHGNHTCYIREESAVGMSFFPLPSLRNLGEVSLDLWSPVVICQWPP